MAMTKKEREYVLALEKELKMVKAFRFTENVELDVFPPDLLKQNLSTGFLFNGYSRSVDVACSSAISHGRGHTNKTTSQGSIKMFSTKKKALMALRHNLEKEFASTLAGIDERIEKEI